MNSVERIPGGIIRRERIRQGIEQKALCEGICVPSYLSKIEKGTVRADMEMINALYQKLGIRCFEDAEEIAAAKQWIDRCFETLQYHLPLEEALKGLSQYVGKIEYSVLAPDYYIVLGLNGQDVIASLNPMRDCLTAQQSAWYCLLRTRKGDSVPREELRQSADLIGTSYALNLYAYSLYSLSEYMEILEMEDRVTALALREGNTFALADYYGLKGAAYSCLFLEDMMMVYYQRAIRLLQYTGWRDECRTMYYNIGATLISSGKYDEAEKYLKLAEEEPDAFLLLHKRAILEIRRGNKEAGQAILREMDRLAGEQKDAYQRERKLRIKALRMELTPGFLAEAEYLDVLDALMEELKQNHHIGHVSFYQDVYLAACRQQRKYRKAFEYTKLISLRY